MCALTKADILFISTGDRGLIAHVWPAQREPAVLSSYLIELIVLLGAAVIAVPLFQALRLGAVPGFLVAGIVVGPSGLGLIDNVSEIAHFAELGVVLLLFVIGIELRPARLWTMRRLVFGLGTLQVVVTGCLLTAILHWLFGIRLSAAVLIGPALALSSTAFVLQLLTEQKLLTSGYGRAAFSVLLLQDLAVVPLLALVTLLAMPELSIGMDVALALGETLIILALVILGGRYLLHPLLHRVARAGSPEVFTASAVLLVLGAAVVTEHIGLTMAMGAFLAGLLIADSAYRHQVMAEIQSFRGLLLGLFFVSMGMSLNLADFIAEPLASLGLVAGLMTLKVLVLWPLTRLFHLAGRAGLAVALVLAQSGEFALVLFALAHQNELLADGLFQRLLLVVLLSMLVTPLLAEAAKRLVRGQSGARPEPPQRENRPTPVRVILAGFGRVGHRIGRILDMADLPYVAVDRDAELVAAERAAGHPVFFGDACRPEVLRGLGIDERSIVIVTLDDLVDTERLVGALHQAYPQVEVLARAADAAQCRQLQQRGAAVTVSETLEASLELARSALYRVGGKEHEAGAVLRRFKQRYYAEIARAGPPAPNDRR
jgi:monovalent cation:proton antiporter-2 (CPA2) family protein